MILTNNQRQKSCEWVQYNPLTDSYDTPDGTSVAAYLFEQASCLADFLAIANIRNGQRNDRQATMNKARNINDRNSDS